MVCQLTPDKITLTKESWSVPDTMSFGNDVVVPVKAGVSKLNGK